MLRYLSVLTALAFSLQPIHAQRSTIDDVLEKLSNYAENYPQEKVYLHLDKPYYTVGDDIWFKAYVTIGVYNNLSGLSKILNVDLIGPEDKIVQSIRLPLISGITMGDFQLADSLHEGNYRIRAYTNWMRNFDSDRFYDRVLPIGNARTDVTEMQRSDSGKNSSGRRRAGSEVAFTDRKRGPMADTTVDPRATEVLKTAIDTKSIQFFPESGNMIAGNLTKVAFKALKSDGLGIAVSGHVVDEAGNRITAFESAYAGMGSFTFIPQAGSRYTAKVNYIDETEEEAPLPEVLVSGYALAVNNELDKQVFVKAFASDDLVNGQEVLLLSQRDGRVYYASKSKLTKNELIFSIPREYLPAGVVQLTLFSANMHPLAERTIFCTNEKPILPLTVATDQETYGSRQRVSVQVAAGQQTDSIRIAALSAAVIDLDKVPVDSGTHEGNIYASLLLTSDIRGYIETPEYYFEHSNLSKQRQLDNVMLAQGWSRIRWTELVAGKMPAITYQPEQDLRISGMVTKRDGKTPVPHATVTVLSTSHEAAAMDTITDEHGRFAFDRLLFYDNTKFVVQARDERGRKDVDIHLDESSQQQVVQNRNTPDATVNVNQSISTYLQHSQEQFQEMEKYGLKEKAILLEEVKVTRETEERKVKHSSNLNGPGNADQIITADELNMGCATLDMCLQGRLLGVVFRNGIPYSTRSMNQPMQVVLDGMFLEASALPMVNPFDVETIEVLRGVGNTAIYGSRGGGGVLIITTKRGDSGGYNRDLYTPGIVTHSPQGYYEVREFYVPDYSAPIDSIADMRDLRTTIHWEPNLVTDKSGNASFEFYTADGPGTYRILVEGLGASGRLGRAVHYITVK